jgi:hypothetical protein
MLYSHFHLILKDLHSPALTERILNPGTTLRMQLPFSVISDLCQISESNSIKIRFFFFFSQALPLSLSVWNPNLESRPQNYTDQNGKSIFSRIDPFYLHNLPYN